MLYRINMLSWAGVGGSLAGCWRSFGNVDTVGVFGTAGKVQLRVGSYAGARLHVMPSLPSDTSRHPTSQTPVPKKSPKLLNSKVFLSS